MISLIYKCRRCGERVRMARRKVPTADRDEWVANYNTWLLNIAHGLSDDSMQIHNVHQCKGEDTLAVTDLESVAWESDCPLCGPGTLTIPAAGGADPPPCPICGGEG